jgi:hypothetical protein
LIRNANLKKRREEKRREGQAKNQGQNTQDERRGQGEEGKETTATQTPDLASSFLRHRINTSTEDVAFDHLQQARVHT